MTTSSLLPLPLTFSSSEILISASGFPSNDKRNQIMESDLGKLFIGGISWDTDENRLKEYFGQFGEVVETVIMRDKVTGRARGFGFVVFSDPKAAERVLMENHVIDGRTVEAKKAVPREDQHHILTRNSNSIHESPGPTRVKKIFVGGLASTVTESDFKSYFEQFGTVKDVVVMYDHNTQRPRGFGFITYDSEDAVDRVLYKTFHELNGKMVEVKRAVPKELSPGPSRSPLVGYNSYGSNRSSNIINSYPQGYNFSSVGGYGRFNSIGGGRSGFSSIGAAGYGVNMNMDPGFVGNYGISSGIGNNPGRHLSPYLSGISGRYNTPVGYTGANARNDSLFSSTSRNVWGSGSFNNSTNASSPGAFLGSGIGNFGPSFGSSGSNWGSSPITSQRAGGNPSGYAGGNLGYGFGDGNHGLGSQIYGRNIGSNTSLTTPLSGSAGGLNSSHGDIYRGSSAYGDSTWRASESVRSGSFDFGLNNGASDVTAQPSDGYNGGYTVANRQSNRGVAA